MNTKELIKADFDAWCKWHQTEANLKAIWRYLRQPECRLILHMRLYGEGGGNRTCAWSAAPPRHKTSQPISMVARPHRGRSHGDARIQHSGQCQAHRA